MANRLLFLAAFLSGFFMEAQVTVTGVIINSDTQQPVAGANILFENAPEISTFSNENGYFQLESEQDYDSLTIIVVDYPRKYVSLQKGDNLNLIIEFSEQDRNEPDEQEQLVNYVKVTGQLIDSDTQQPVADADIFLKDTQVYASSDENGYFELEANKYIDSLQIITEKFPTKYIPLQRGENSGLIINFSVNDKSDTKKPAETGKEKDLDEIIVTGFPKKRPPKKENPAYTILQELWKRRRTNGLANFENYQYKEYEKIEFDLNNIDSTFISKKIFRKLSISTQDIDTLDISGKTYIPVFLNESISDIVGQNIPTKREKSFLRGNKASGIPNNDIVSNTVKNLYKDVNIYDNVLNFFNKGFTSPIATVGFSVYDYLLADTVMVDGVQCYYIKYKPRRNNELTFKGDLYITKDTYAVKQVTLQSTSGINVNFVKDIYMELDYDNINDSIFVPLRNYTVLDMSLITKKDGAKGMFAKRTLTYNDYQFDKPQKEIETLLDKQWEPMSEGAYDKEDDFWAENRPERLGEDDKKAYELVDKVSKTRLFRNIVDGVQVLSSGYINIGNVVDIGDLYQSFGFNEVEGLRLRAGARTYFTPNDMWRLEAYTAYGFKDEQLKYGAEARFMFNKFNRFTIGVGTKRDIIQLGVSLTESEGIMTRSFASSSIISRGDNEFLSSVNQTNVFLSIEPWKNVQLRLDGTSQYIKSANPEKFNIGYHNKEWNIKEDLYDSHLTLSLEARPGAKYSRYGLDRYEHTTLAPTIILKYIKGIKGVFNSGFDYDKIQALYSQPILWGPVGKTNVTFEFGKSFNKLPLSLLGVIPGNQSYGIISTTFSQLNYYDFVTDIYSALHVEHHFNGRIFSYIPLLKKLQFREIVFFRGAWGDISEGSKNMNASNIIYTAPNKDIYYEYGFGIENIGLGNLRIFRVDFNWRGNYLDMPEINKFGMKVGMQFTF
ncbi:MAG: DUF5686 and carboxypeptidase regulatory-like domain-containing protein [Flavobacteriaceae bacterium]|jgi:hypothetical protein|nr:DUF5686 and carboxypeptidase regulatory-like domain-containing protein [Flavobacteriaceae bacterium]